jgi:hypothetical protein
MGRNRWLAALCLLALLAGPFGAASFAHLAEHTAHHEDDSARDDCPVCLAAKHTTLEPVLAAPLAAPVLAGPALPTGPENLESAAPRGLQRERSPPFLS